jgi:type IV pilus assembly protein PilB
MKGRVAIYELMPVTEELRSLILRGAPTADLREVAESQGMKSLRQAALRKAVDGVTTLEEVLRVTMS